MSIFKRRRREEHEIDTSRLDDTSTGMEDLEDNFDFDDPFEKGDRRPASKTKLRVKSALKSVFTGYSSATNQHLRKEMPHTAEAVDTFKEIGREGRTLVEHLKKEAGPEVIAIKRAANSLLKPVGKYIPEKWADRLDRWTKVDEETRESEEQMRTAAITSSIEEIFAKQAESDAEERREEDSERLQDRALESVRHTDQMGGLGALREGVLGITNFLHTTYTAYLRKSLELKYRHLYTAQDLLASSKVTLQLLETKLEAVVHNTGLPEYVKQTQSERFMSTLMGKKYASFQDWIGSYIPKVAKNIKERLVDNITGGLSMTSMAFEMASSMADSLGDDDFGDEMLNPVESMVTQGLGGMVGGFLFRMIGKERMKKLIPVFRDVEKSTAGLKQRMTMGLDTFRQSYEYADPKSLSTMGKVLQQIVSFLPDYETQYSYRNMAMQDPAAPAIFDNATRLSIVEVIPSYLSRIVQYTGLMAKGGAETDPLYKTDPQYAKQRLSLQSKIRAEDDPKKKAALEQQLARVKEDEATKLLPTIEEEVYDPSSRKLVTASQYRTNLRNRALSIAKSNKRFKYGKTETPRERALRERAESSMNEQFIRIFGILAHATSSERILALADPLFIVFKNIIGQGMTFNAAEFVAFLGEADPMDASEYIQVAFTGIPEIEIKQEIATIIRDACYDLSTGHQRLSVVKAIRDACVAVSEKDQLTDYTRQLVDLGHGRHMDLDAGGTLDGSGRTTLRKILDFLLGTSANIDPKKLKEVAASVSAGVATDAREEEELHRTDGIVPGTYRELRDKLRDLGKGSGVVNSAKIEAGLAGKTVGGDGLDAKFDMLAAFEAEHGADPEPTSDPKPTPKPGPTPDPKPSPDPGPTPGVEGIDAPITIPPEVDPIITPPEPITPSNFRTSLLGRMFTKFGSKWGGGFGKVINDISMKWYTSLPTGLQHATEVMLAAGGMAALASPEMIATGGEQASLGLLSMFLPRGIKEQAFDPDHRKEELEQTFAGLDEMDRSSVQQPQIAQPAPSPSEQQPQIAQPAPSPLPQDADSTTRMQTSLDELVRLTTIIQDHVTKNLLVTDGTGLLRKAFRGVKDAGATVYNKAARTFDRIRHASIGKWITTGLELPGQAVEWAWGTKENPAWLRKFGRGVYGAGSYIGHKGWDAAKWGAGKGWDAAKGAGRYLRDHAPAIGDGALAAGKFGIKVAGKVARGGARAGWALAKAPFQVAGAVLGISGGFFDVYGVKGAATSTPEAQPEVEGIDAPAAMPQAETTGGPQLTDEPILTAARQKQGVFTENTTRLSRTSMITTPIYGDIGKSEVLITQEQLNAGLFRKDGRPINSVAAKSPHADEVRAAARKAGTGSLRELASDGIRGIGRGIGKGAKFLWGQRDKAAAAAGTGATAVGYLGKKAIDLGDSALRGVGRGIAGVAGKITGIGKGGKVELDRVTTRLDVLRNILMHMTYQNAHALGLNSGMEYQMTAADTALIKSVDPKGIPVKGKISRMVGSMSRWFRGLFGSRTAEGLSGQGGDGSAQAGDQAAGGAGAPGTEIDPVTGGIIGGGIVAATGAVLSAGAAYGKAGIKWGVGKLGGKKVAGMIAQEGLKKTAWTGVKKGAMWGLGKGWGAAKWGAGKGVGVAKLTASPLITAAAVIGGVGRSVIWQIYRSQIVTDLVNSHFPGAPPELVKDLGQRFETIMSTTVGMFGQFSNAAQEAALDEFTHEVDRFVWIITHMRQTSAVIAHMYDSGMSDRAEIYKMAMALRNVVSNTKSRDILLQDLRFQNTLPLWHILEYFDNIAKPTWKDYLLYKRSNRSLSEHQARESTIMESWNASWDKKDAERPGSPASSTVPESEQQPQIAQPAPSPLPQDAEFLPRGIKEQAFDPDHRKEELEQAYDGLDEMDRSSDGDAGIPASARRLNPDDGIGMGGMLYLPGGKLSPGFKPRPLDPDALFGKPSPKWRDMATMTQDEIDEEVLELQRRAIARRQDKEISESVRKANLTVTSKVPQKSGADPAQQALATMTSTMMDDSKKMDDQTAVISELVKVATQLNAKLEQSQEHFAHLDTIDKTLGEQTKLAKNRKPEVVVVQQPQQPQNNAMGRSAINLAKSHA